MPRKISILSLLFCVLLAIALWGYVSLKAPTTIFISFPLVVQPQDERAVLNELPKSIAVKIRTSGWQIINLQYFGANPQCIVDLSKLPELPNSEYKITKNDLLQNLLPPLSLEKIVELSPESFTIQTGSIARKTIPIHPSVEVTPRVGFSLIGALVVEPDSVHLRGTPALIRAIEHWQTQNRKLTDITKPFRIEIPLVDSLKNHIVFSPQTVVISGDIQQTSEMTFYDIPVEISSLPNRTEHTIRPLKISITVRGGTEQLSQLDARLLRATIDYNKILQDSSGIIFPVISMPPSLTLLATIPPYLRHKKVIQKAEKK
ncbi:MAG: hypothetical protein IPM69_08825 [Ignavibacteria bacterium]|nr:hypothetical protein [Ignavibacteria bacterium]